MTRSQSPEPPSRRPLDFETLWSMERLSSPAISRDGRRMAWVVTTQDHEENESESHLWMASLVAGDREPPRRLTWQKGKHSGPAWSPDGRFLAFSARRGGDEKAKSQIYRLPVDGGEAEPLTDLPVAASSPRWLPDGQRLVFQADTFPGIDDDFEALRERLSELEDDKVGAQITENRLVRYWDTYRTDGRVPHLFLLDTERREICDLMPGVGGLLSFMSFDWDLAPDGSELAYSANVTPEPWRELVFGIFRVPILDDGPGEARPLAQDPSVWDRAPMYSPSGRDLFLVRGLEPKRSSSYSHLMRYDLGSGTLERLAPDWDAEASAWAMGGDGTTLLLHAQDAARSHLFGLPIHAPGEPPAGAPTLLLEGGVTSSVVCAENGQLAVLRQSFSAPPSLWTARLASSGGADGAPRLLDLACVADPNRERLAMVRFGTVEDIRFTGAEDESVQMWVLKPPGFDPSRRYPLVLLLHGGPHSAWLDAFHTRWNGALFAAQGWVTAMLNFHGSSGFGEAFCASIEGAHAEKPFLDAMRAVDHLLAEPWVDNDRLAAAGGSFGGYMVSWLLGHTNRFKAMVCHAGVYDLMGQFASDYTWSRGTSYGAEPWEDPGRIDRWSPSRYAANFETPTLVLHGERDYRVPVTQGINLYHVLQGKGVPARLVLFPRENHWVLKPQAAALWWEEVAGWLERFLGPVELEALEGDGSVDDEVENAT